jgi:hypothetical protein
MNLSDEKSQQFGEALRTRLMVARAFCAIAEAEICGRMSCAILNSFGV